MTYKILIIEDELPMQKALKDKFTRDNFEVILANDGEQGLKTALAEKPDAIILDIIMPVMDGIAMLQRLRQDKWGQSVPVFVLTNLSDVEKAAQSAESRVCEYMVKSSWSLEDIVTRVKEELEHRLTHGEL